MKPYPAYKDSGVEWLGQIPLHWQALPNRSLFSEVIERDSPDEPMLSVTIAKGVIRQADLLADSAKKDASNENKSNYKLVQPGDIAYNKMRAWQGAVGVSNYRGIVSPAYIVVRPRIAWTRLLNTKYFHYLLRTPTFAKEAERWSYGITSDQWSLRANDFKQIYSALPTAQEQAKIVRFIEQADNRINRLIRAKRRIIELLNEQKQTVIRTAITRGFDPKVQLKPSGIDWLGDIPEHWFAQKLKYLVNARGGMTPSKARTDYWVGNIPWVSPKDMKSDEIGDTVLHISQEALIDTNISLIIPPAVLFVVRGMILARTFPTAVTRCPVTVNQDMKALLPLPRITAQFLRTMLIGAQAEILEAVEEAGHGTRCLRTDTWRNLMLPVPPKLEQDYIVSEITNSFAELETVIQRTHREMELVREYRTRLIADVVTGKIDVRDVALPEIDGPIEYDADEDEVSTNEADGMEAEEDIVQ